MTNTTRRQFIASAAAAGVMAKLGVAAPSARQGRLVKGRKINIACVGCGGKGADDVRQFSGENIVALCDVDLARASQAVLAHPKARLFRDWREMLAVMDGEIDAVVVSTPDHMHFPIALRAIELGKHVYVQKPLTHTVKEARLLLEAARRHNVVTQMGNQGHSNESTRLFREMLDADAIGDVTEVKIWTNRPVWPQDKELPKGEMAVPATLDWNLWLGVAPWRPYNRAYMPFDWRGWWDYGSGAIGDMGCHTMDAAFWGLQLGAPESVSAEVVGGSEFSCPKGSIVTYTFPARGKRPPVTLKWYDGCCKPERPAVLPEGEPMPGSGQLFTGTKGFIFCPGDYCDSARLLPKSLADSFKRPPKTLPRIVNGHYQNWLDGIRGVVDAPCSNFEHAVPLTEIALLGAVAVRARGSFKWDAAALKCDNPDAQRYISKVYRMF